MKKEFVNPTMKFSFFSRENIVTDSTLGDNTIAAQGKLNEAMQEAMGGETAVSSDAIKTVKLSNLEFSL